MNKKMKVIKGIIIVLFLITIVLTIAIIYLINKSEKNDEDIGATGLDVGFYYESLLENNNSKSDYSSNEEYTDFNYYYLRVYDNDDILEEITYVRYVYQNDNWVLAENKNNSPFFSQTGNGITVDSEHYYIPIYELEEGKNKVIVTETTNEGTKREKEFIINRTPSEYDNIYQIKNVDKSDTLTLNTYQEVIDINMNDYNDILLTGSFYSNYDIKNITWTRYKRKNNSEEWEISPQSQTNRSDYQNQSEAKIYGNYWAIDILDTNDNGEKVEITATDSSGAKITKTVFINNTSVSINYNDKNFNNSDGNITYDNGIEFINNEVLITFNSNVKESRCEEIINEINGNVVASLGVIKEYEVQVNYKFTTYSEIEAYCEMLKEQYDEIMDVSVNMVMPMPEPY